jgi:hypothetical protein
LLTVPCPIMFHSFVFGKAERQYGSSAIAQSPVTDAPIGLVWGSSSSEVQSKGIELKEIEGTDFGKSYVASKMERALADQSAALLSFGFKLMKPGHDLWDTRPL